MTPTKEQIEALAVVLDRCWNGFLLDDGEPSLNFGDYAAAILAALDGWTLVRTGTEGQRREALDLVERQQAKNARLRKIEEAARTLAPYIWGAEPPMTAAEVQRAVAALRAALEAKT